MDRSELTEEGLSKRGEFSAYVKAVADVIGQLLLQVVAALIACVLVIFLLWLLRTGPSSGFRVMATVEIGSEGLRRRSILEWSQLAVECFFLVFVLTEFGKALVRIARVGGLRGVTGGTNVP